MNNLKDIMYAGLGLAKHTETQIKETYDVLVAKGKRIDEEGKNVINDLFKSLEEGKEKMLKLKSLQWRSLYQKFSMN